MNMVMSCSGSWISLMREKGDEREEGKRRGRDEKQRGKRRERKKRWKRRESLKSIFSCVLYVHSPSSVINPSDPCTDTIIPHWDSMAVYIHTYQGVGPLFCKAFSNNSNSNILCYYLGNRSEGTSRANSVMEKTGSYFAVFSPSPPST